MLGGCLPEFVEAAALFLSLRAREAAQLLLPLIPGSVTIREAHL